VKKVPKLYKRINRRAVEQSVTVPWGTSHVNHDEGGIVKGNDSFASRNRVHISSATKGRLGVGGRPVPTRFISIDSESTGQHVSKQDWEQKASAPVLTHIVPRNQ
jgi:hypothetical protein